MEIVGLVRVLTNVCALRRQKQLGRAHQISGPHIQSQVVQILLPAHRIRLNATQDTLRLEQRHVPMEIGTRLPVKCRPLRHLHVGVHCHGVVMVRVIVRATMQHAIMMMAIVLKPVLKHTFPIIPTVEVMQALDIRVWVTIVLH